MIAELIFWCCVGIIVYHYALFNFIVHILSTLKKTTIVQGQSLPPVSIVIAAYNEEKVIEQKILNTFELDYPRDKYEIIVVSDGSTDTTSAIVEKFGSSGVIGLYDPVRKGKAVALNRAANSSNREILFFTDANTFLDRKSLKMLVRNFTDSRVGGVSGKKIVTRDSNNRSASMGDQTYWQFESALKQKESKIDSIPTGDGEIFAIRRILFQTLPEGTINDDSAITFDIVKQGFRVIYDADATSTEKASTSLEDDFNVKARMVYGGMQIIKRYNNFLKQYKSFFVFQFYSHKILRYSMPIFLVLLLMSNTFLSGTVYLTFFIAQVLFYVLALIGFHQYRIGKRTPLFYYPMYYCMVNLAALIGIVYFFQNKSPNEIWKKAVR